MLIADKVTELFHITDAVVPFFLGMTVKKNMHRITLWTTFLVWKLCGENEMLYLCGVIRGAWSILTLLRIYPQMI